MSRAGQDHPVLYFRSVVELNSGRTSIMTDMRVPRTKNGPVKIRLS